MENPTYTDVKKTKLCDYMRLYEVTWDQSRLHGIRRDDTRLQRLLGIT